MPVTGDNIKGLAEVRVLDNAALLTKLSAGADPRTRHLLSQLLMPNKQESARCAALFETRKDPLLNFASGLAEFSRLLSLFISEGKPLDHKSDIFSHAMDLLALFWIKTQYGIITNDNKLNQPLPAYRNATMLTLLAANRDWGFVNALLACFLAGGAILKKDDLDRTPLNYLAMTQNVEGVALILGAAKADNPKTAAEWIIHPDCYGISPLQIALQLPNPAIFFQFFNFIEETSKTSGDASVAIKLMERLKCAYIVSEEMKRYVQQGLKNSWLAKSGALNMAEIALPVVGRFFNPEKLRVQYGKCQPNPDDNRVRDAFNGLLSGGFWDLLSPISPEAVLFDTRLLEASKNIRPHKVLMQYYSWSFATLNLSTVSPTPQYPGGAALLGSQFDVVPLPDLAAPVPVPEAPKPRKPKVTLGQVLAAAMAEQPLGAESGQASASSSAASMPEEAARRRAIKLAEAKAAAEKAEAARLSAIMSSPPEKEAAARRQAIKDEKRAEAEAKAEKAKAEKAEWERFKVLPDRQKIQEVSRTGMYAYFPRWKKGRFEDAEGKVCVWPTAKTRSNQSQEKRDREIIERLIEKLPAPPAANQAIPVLEKNLSEVGAIIFQSPLSEEVQLAKHIMENVRAVKQIRDAGMPDKTQTGFIALSFQLSLLASRMSALYEKNRDVKRSSEDAKAIQNVRTYFCKYFSIHQLNKNSADGLLNITKMFALYPDDTLQIVGSSKAYSKIKELLEKREIDIDVAKDLHHQLKSAQESLKILSHHDGRDLAEQCMDWEIAKLAELLKQSRDILMLKHPYLWNTLKFVADARNDIVHHNVGWTRARRFAISKQIQDLDLTLLLPEETDCPLQVQSVTWTGSSWREKAVVNPEVGENEAARLAATRKGKKPAR